MASWNAGPFQGTLYLIEPNRRHRLDRRKQATCLDSSPSIPSHPLLKLSHVASVGPRDGQQLLFHCPSSLIISASFSIPEPVNSTTPSSLMPSSLIAPLNSVWFRFIFLLKLPS